MSGSAQTIPHPSPAVKVDPVFPAPSTRVWQERFIQASTTDLPAVLATGKVPGAGDTVFVTASRESLQTFAKVVYLPKDLMGERSTRFDPKFLEVIDTPEGKLLFLKARVFGHALSPFPNNERFVDSIPFNARPKVQSSLVATGLKITLPVGQTLQETFKNANKCLEDRDNKRGYNLTEDLRHSGQKEAGIAVAVEYCFSGAHDLSEAFAQESAQIELEPNPIKRAELTASLERRKAAFHQNLHTTTQFSGNNRAHDCREVFGTEDHHYLTGFQGRLLHPEQPGAVLDLEKALRDHATMLNNAISDPDHKFFELASGAKNLATVPVRFLLASENPSRLMPALRYLNNQEHARPPLQFEENVKRLSQAKELVAYVGARGLLKPLLASAPMSPLSPLLADPKGLPLLEEVLLGDEPWRCLMPLLTAGGAAVELLDVEVALVDLIRTICLPTTRDGQEAIRKVLLEPAKNSLGRDHFDIRFAVMLAAIGMILGFPAMNPRIMDGMSTKTRLTKGVGPFNHGIEAHLSRAKSSSDEWYELWLWRLLPYLAAAKILMANVGSALDQKVKYIAADTGTEVQASTPGVRRNPSDALAVLNLRDQGVQDLAVQLAENLITARKAYLTDGQDGAPFEVPAFKASYDPNPAPVKADKHWFDRTFTKIGAGSKTPVAKSTGIVDPISKGSALATCATDYLNLAHDAIRRVPAALRGITLFTDEETLRKKVNSLREKALACANETGMPVTPISSEASSGLLEDIKTARAEAIEELKTLSALLGDAFGVLRAITTEVSTPVAPDDPFDQPGALGDLAAILAEVEEPLVEDGE